ncbi:MAG: family oxidoreductase [Rhizobacter sp.]|nr:family oxidoreductase [Rhizobacter sp.]
MPIEDLKNLPENVHLSADVCLVGSGPAAWTLSKELADAGIRVLVLESAGSRLADETTALNETEDVGMPLFNGRCRIFGGSTESPGWGNRCTKLDAIDYERRPWVPQSGWPFGPEEVEPYFAKAARYLGTKDIFSSSFTPPAYTGVTKAKIDEALLSHVFWGYGSDLDRGPTRFSNAFRSHGSDNVRVIQNATVTHLDIEPQSGRIASVEIADSAGRRKTIPARLVVLCAGGIENARLLLNSNRQVAAGLGNRFDLVGRFLMDHPRDCDMAITLDPREAPKLHRIFGTFSLDGDTGPREFVGGFALSAKVQREEGLLNCAAWPMEDADDDDPIEATLRLVRRKSTERSADLRRLGSRPAHLFRAYRSWRRDQPMFSLPKKAGFYIGSEQTPNADSRVSLSDRLDRFGLPIARTDWRVGRMERASQGRLAKIMVAEFKRLGLPELRLARWIEDEAYDDTVLQDGCHPTATTRMAAEPTSGVVDPNCEVFGVEGLFVAGSSTFPTAGHANPTLMIVAMACRLAEHLKTRVDARVLAHGPAADAEETVVEKTIESEVAQPSVPRVPAGTRVAVTGANGFIGGRLVERLTEQGAVVVCLNRGDSNARVRRTGATARRLDLADANATKAALEGVQVVFHCAYDWSDEAWNLRALSSLIAAATENRCERFVHISSFVVYQGPSSGEVTETTEETTADSGYARTKRNMELQLLEAHREHGFPCAILQPTVVYGPYSSPWTVQPAERLKFGTVILPAPGDGLCPAVHVDDVVDAMLICATHPGAVGERFLVSGPDVVTWGRFYELLAKAVGVAGPRYMTLDRIEADNKRIAKLRRFLTTPEQLVRRGAQVGPIRKALKKTLPALPPGLRSDLDDRLYGPDSRRRGRVHLPDLGSARWMSGQSTIPSRKAMQRLGYRPRVSLSEGMASLEPYLRELLSK